MNLHLQRRPDGIRPDGIFSNVIGENGPIGVGLEHAYPVVDGRGEAAGEGQAGTYAPKLPAGTYECVRSMHRLHGMDHDFETFEITGVPGHSGVLFHWGNWNEDSEGCVLLGEAIALGEHNGAHVEMVTNSRAAFARFMALQEGVERFVLTVEG